MVNKNRWIMDGVDDYINFDDSFDSSKKHQDEILEKLFDHLKLGSFEDFINMNKSEREEWIRNIKLKNILEDSDNDRN